MRGHGRSRVLFGTNWPMLSPARSLERLDSLGLDDEATELYLGGGRMRKQLKYADDYDIPLVILFGSDEKQKAVVTVKDMVAGRERAKPVADRKEYLAQRAGQVVVPRAELVDAIRKMLAEIE